MVIGGPDAPLKSLLKQMKDVIESGKQSMELDAFYIPIAASDLTLIENSLASLDVFTPSFVPEHGEDVYKAITYRIQGAHHDTETVLLADRNLVTRWVGIARGGEASKEGRTAAAVMAFAHCGNILIEPNIALYEAAATLGSGAMNDELAVFRLADNSDVAEWASIALGRTARLEESYAMSQEPPGDSSIDFSMPLRRWRRNYVIALKIAELELRGGRSDVRMVEMLHWMYEEFLLAGPALALAAHYLAPNSLRQGLLSGIRSPNRERALLSVCNVAWDLTLLSEWALRTEQQEQSGRLTLLASLDRWVHKVARTIAKAASLTLDPQDSALFQGLWGEQRGRRLDALYSELRTTADNPARQLHRPVSPAFIDNLIADGESFIRSWGEISNGGA